jgi:tetratricopeptide (TPR) repeat protein
MGTLLFAMGRQRDAVGYLERAHAAAPGDARLAYQLGAVLIGQGQAGRGIGLMLRAVELDPLWVQAMNGAAAALNGVGDAGRALEMYRKSLAVDPGQADALCGLGGVLVGSGRVREAAAVFRDAGRRHPANAEVMGKLLSVLNYTDDAEPGEVFEAHRRWGEIVMGRGTDGWRGPSYRGRAVGRAHEKKLRVGVSCRRISMTIRARISCGRSWRTGTGRSLTPCATRGRSGRTG